MTQSFTYLSLGAGLQSTALYLLCERGDPGFPRPDAAIFADTGAEPSYVYQHLERLKQRDSIPILVAKPPSLEASLIDRNGGKWASIPAWTRGSDGRASPLRRQCTREYKITPIERLVRSHLGYKPRQRIKHRVLCLIGISADEAGRAKPSRCSWVENVFPLLDANYWRADCERVCRDEGLSVPGKSSCVFCPYHGDRYWRQLKGNYPDEWNRAVAVDQSMRDATTAGESRKAYLHRSLIPLDKLSLDSDQTEFDWFNEECDGICGV